VKIIPLGVNRRLIDACRLAINAPPLAVAELLPHRAALILSQLPGTKENAFAHATASTRQRLETLGSRLAFEVRCPHRVDNLEDALRQSLAAGCNLILMFCATMTKDRNDVAPTAIVAAGGRIERMGMPVEPGNMLTLAHIGDVPVIVLPGCARSQRLNGLDWVLRRLLAKLPMNADDIAAMGVGGLIRTS
jgi:molybdenum cofactor cytidylyltransferase